ncbi:patched domain-containing protein 3-like [Asterias amurensis]|uniref:patched domain-containing protein 3-like n=1 Tax=Asterias amurensis TaxID=7602 RepID=UPI003AB2F0BA
MAFDCIEKGLRSFFFNYGGFIAKHPFPFLLLPLVLSGALGAGLVFIREEQSVENLYTPENGQAKTDRATVEELFAEHGDNNTLVARLTRLGRSGKIIIERNDGGNILKKTVLEEILNLHEKILTISVMQNGQGYNFSDLCVKWNGDCNENAILYIYNYNASMLDSITLTYPIYNSNNEVLFLGGELGGVEFKSGSPGEVFSADVMQLSYILRNQDSMDDQRSAVWEDEFLQVVEAFNSTEIRVTRQVSSTIETELDKASSNVIKDFTITFTLLITFSICSCVMLDWVRSKPWLAGCGVISAGLAVLSSFGLMCYIGVPYINVVGSTPFLILGIGVDDMFIMVAAWRQTDVRQTVEQRMRHAFTEAAMSITITSITDALAFGIGAITYFRSVRIFCMYTGVAVIFDYVYQITFFGACMALFGRREAANRHCMSCLKVKPKEETNSTAYKIFCAGGSQPPADQGGELNDHALMIFFKKYYGPFITRWWMISLIIVSYLGYQGAAIYGCTQVQEGLNLRNLARDNSYSGNFLDMESVYFKTYGPQVALVFTERRDVWNPIVQDIMEQTLAKMEDNEYTFSEDQGLSASWLRDYLAFLNSINRTEPNQAEFVDTLRDVFLTQPAFEHYSLDIVFNGTNIEASRFFVATKDLDTTNKERFMMTELRQIAKDSELPVMVYHPAFIFYDNYIAVLPNTLQNMGIAVGAMFIIALLMIPNPICSILVTLAVASIVTGVIGYMTFWQVNLDSIAMTNIILCIGFSVDFSAHICYAYIVANRGSRQANIIHALYSIGMPIVQGSLSTILGVLVLAFTDSYIFRTFFKTMFLVISIGALHGLLFIPVFLKVTIPVKSRVEESTSKMIIVDGVGMRSPKKHGEINTAMFPVQADRQPRPAYGSSQVALRPFSVPYSISSRKSMAANTPLPPSPRSPEQDYLRDLASVGSFHIPRARPMSAQRMRQDGFS